jgi:hypothetical protein
MPSATQPCAEVGCDQPGAFRTRTRPTWCHEHVTALVRRAGLQPLEPFTGPKAWWLTRCLACECETHVRFEQALEWHGRGEPACRACHWRNWAGATRRVQGAHAAHQPAVESKARAHAEANGYTYLGPLTNPSLGDDPHHVRCNYCHRLSAERLADIGWGCHCQVNPSRAAQTSRDPKSKKKELLKDSNLPVLKWWDHSRNSTDLWATTVVRARREVAWNCPDCGTQFSARVIDMVSHRECPQCEPKRRAQAEAEYQRLTQTPVARIS